MTATVPACPECGRRCHHCLTQIAAAGSASPVSSNNRIPEAVPTARWSWDKEQKRVVLIAANPGDDCSVMT
jgi:hypothetical protein